jgi:hypothetical protein
MSQYEHAHEVPPEEFSQWLHDQERARQRANAQVMMDMLNGGGQAAHQAAHDRITQSTHGLFGASTGQQLGQAAAERPATVGGEWGLGRPLERNGHLAQSIGPAPARVDLTRVNDHPGFMQGQEPGVSPLLAHMRGERP